MPASLHVLIVPDKFKGTLTAQQAGEAIAAGWLAARPQDQLEILPMADGGDGFGNILGSLVGAQPRDCATTDAAGRPHKARWWYAPDTHIGILEAAQTNGLALLPTGQYHPFVLDTYGLGALMRAALSAGVRQLYVGIGGSATNDGGFGLARALGWIFLDAQGAQIQHWTDLDRLTHIQAPKQKLHFENLVIAVDVSNPLLGPRGASRIYGPQKGLRQVDMLKAEACLSQLAAVVHTQLGEDIASLPGAGAAGGLGFGLRAFCGGSFRSGADIFAQLAHLPERIAMADIVITAEGALDAQSLMGKGVGAIAAAAAHADKICLCLAGSLSLDTQPTAWPKFRAYAIVPDITTLDDALAHAAPSLTRLAQQVAAKM